VRFLSQSKCRACGKVSHVVGKTGRLQTPANCPYCGIENPYPNSPGIVLLVIIAAAGAALLFWMTR
jgi:hypothetical protein